MLQISCSQGSRTSSTNGWSRVVSPSHHDGFFANNGEQAPARSQAGLKFLVEHRCRASQYNHVIGCVAAPATRTVADFKRNVANIVRGESFGSLCAKRRVEFNARHMRGAACQQSGHIAAASADFEDAISRFDGQFLQHARLEFRRQHLFIGSGAGDQRNFHVKKRKATVLRQHKFLTAHLEEQIQYLRIEHIPGPDLLLDHVEAGLFNISSCSHEGRRNWAVKGQKNECSRVAIIP